MARDVAFDTTVWRDPLPDEVAGWVSKGRIGTYLGEGLVVVVVWARAFSCRRS